jgi:hypothetical protein
VAKNIYEPIDVDGYYYILFGIHPSKDLTLAEILADIFERNPQIYNMIERDLRLTNPDRHYPIN